jgi:hypothetical protein
MRMVECKFKPQNKLKTMFFSNENEKSNHEKVEDKELTSLSETIRRMDARNSHNQAPKFKGKRGVLDSNIGKVKMIMVKRTFIPFYLLLPFVIGFYNCLFIKT